MTERQGQCMCGAVRFTARDVPTRIGACHCVMCRRWTGSALLGVTLPKENVTWQGERHIARAQTSAWAERAWCQNCGSGLWFRVTKESDYSGDIEIPVGLFDDADGFELVNEIYIDQKPDSYAYAGEGRTLLTRADCIAKFADLAEEPHQIAYVPKPATPKLRAAAMHLRQDSDLRITYYPGQTKTAVVVFNSAGFSLWVEGQNDEFIGTARGDDGHHVISVTDQTRGWYSAPGMADRIVQDIADLRADKGWAHLRTLGSSMGGHGALLFAERLGADVAIAFAPQFTMRAQMNEPRWSELRPAMREANLPALGPYLTGKTKAMCFFGAQSRPDKRHANMIRRRCEAECFAFDGYDHDVAQRLKVDGKLKDVVALASLGDPARVRAELSSLLVAEPKPVQENAQ